MLTSADCSSRLASIMVVQLTRSEPVALVVAARQVALTPKSQQVQSVVVTAVVSPCPLGGQVC